MPRIRIENIQPTVIVGLGGMGVLTARLIRHLCLNSTNPVYKKAVQHERISFLGCDANPMANERQIRLKDEFDWIEFTQINESGPRIRSLERFVYLDKQEVSNACMEICAFLTQKNAIGHFWSPASPDSHESILQWFPPLSEREMEYLITLNTSHARNGLPNRLTARMSLFLSINRLYDEIREAVSATGRHYCRGPIQVNFISSLFGNTGSGILFDTASMLNFMHAGEPIVSKAFLLSGTDKVPETMSQHAKLNTLFSLIELEHYQHKQAPKKNKLVYPYACSPMRFDFNRNFRRLFNEVILLSMDSPVYNPRREFIRNVNYTVHRTAITILSNIIVTQQKRQEIIGDSVPCHDHFSPSFQTALGFLKPLTSLNTCRYKQIKDSGVEIIEVVSTEESSEKDSRISNLTDFCIDNDLPDDIENLFPNLREKYLGMFGKLMEQSHLNWLDVIKKQRDFKSECQKAADQLGIDLWPEGAINFPTISLPESLENDLKQESKDIEIDVRDAIRNSFINPILEPLISFINRKRVLPVDTVEKENLKKLFDGMVDFFAGLPVYTPLKIEQPKRSGAFLKFYEQMKDQEHSDKHKIRKNFTQNVFPHLTNFSDFLNEMENKVEEAVEDKSLRENWFDHSLKDLWDERVEKLFSALISSFDEPNRGLVIIRVKRENLKKCLLKLYSRSDSFSKGDDETADKALSIVMGNLPEEMSDQFSDQSLLKAAIKGIITDCIAVDIGAPDAPDQVADDLKNRAEELYANLMPDTKEDVERASKVLNRILSLSLCITLQAWLDADLLEIDDFLKDRILKGLEGLPFKVSKDFSRIRREVASTMPETDMIENSYTRQVKLERKLSSIFKKAKIVSLPDNQIGQTVFHYEELGWNKKDLHIFNSLMAAYEHQESMDNPLFDFYLSFYRFNDVKSTESSK